MKYYKSFITEALGEEVKPQLDLKPEVNNVMIENLKALLSDLHIVLIKVHNFHWNVGNSPFFGPLHKLFDDVFDHVGGHIDKVAERIRAIGGVAPGSMREFLEMTTLQEDPGMLRPCQEMLTKLVADLEHLSIAGRTIIDRADDDQGTINLLAGFVEDIDKDAWFLRSHIEG